MLLVRVQGGSKLWHTPCMTLAGSDYFSVLLLGMVLILWEGFTQPPTGQWGSHGSVHLFTPGTVRRTLCTTSSTLCGTPGNLCAIPITLCGTPSNLCATPSTLCGTLCNTPSVPLSEGRGSCLGTKRLPCACLGYKRIERAACTMCAVRGQVPTSGYPPPKVPSPLGTYLPGYPPDAVGYPGG